MNSKLFFILLLATISVVASIFWLFSKKDFSFSSEQRDIIDSLSFGSFLKANYSFDADTDADGLSNAKEIIYGSDPLTPDTDGDGFLDGREVQNGFDPLVAGRNTGLLSERKNPNFTVRYFSWLQGKTGDPDPQLNERELQQFFHEQGLLDFSLPLTLDNTIRFTNDDPEKLSEYLAFTDALALPDQGSPYLALAGKLIKNQSFQTLSHLLRTIEKQLKELQSARVPASLKPLHQEYLGIWQELLTIFEGLKQSQQDPAFVWLNKKKGEWIVEKIKETQRLRAMLIADIKLLPFQQHDGQVDSTIQKKENTDE